MDEIRIEEKKRSKDPLEKPIKSFLRLFEKNNYQPLTWVHVKKWALGRGIDIDTLNRLIAKLPVKKELIGEPKTHRWFVRLISPQEKLTLVGQPLLSKKQRGCNILMEMLSPGPRMAREVIAEAVKSQVSIEALRKARRIMHVKTRRVSGGWEWYLTD